MTIPGEVYDAKGYPIYPGDLIRSFHFQERRYRRIHYLYHTAIWCEKHRTMKLVPTSHLEPTKVGGGGSCWLSQSIINDGAAEIIHGCGPDGLLDYTDRKKVKP